MLVLEGEGTGWQQCCRDQCLDFSTGRLQAGLANWSVVRKTDIEAFQLILD